MLLSGIGDVRSRQGHVEVIVGEGNNSHLQTPEIVRSRKRASPSFVIDEASDNNQVQKRLSFAKISDASHTSDEEELREPLLGNKKKSRLNLASPGNTIPTPLPISQFAINLRKEEKREKEAKVSGGSSQDTDDKTLTADDGYECPDVQINNRRMSEPMTKAISSCKCGYVHVCPIITAEALKNLGPIRNSVRQVKRADAERRSVGNATGHEYVNVKPDHVYTKRPSPVGEMAANGDVQDKNPAKSPGNLVSPGRESLKRMGYLAAMSDSQDEGGNSEQRSQKNDPSLDWDKTADYQ